MKKIYFFKAICLLLLLLSFKLSMAQSTQSAQFSIGPIIPPTAEIDNSFYNRMNDVFSPLEKNRVPYHLKVPDVSVAHLEQLRETLNKNLTYTITIICNFN